MPLKARLKDLEIVKLSLENSIKIYERELDQQTKENSRLSEEVSNLREKLIEYNTRWDDLRKELKTDDFRVYNFDRIKRERDLYEEEKNRLLKEKSKFELSLSVLENEKRSLQERNSDINLKLRHQEKDLFHYKNESIEAKSELGKCKDALSKLNTRIKVEQERSEDLHEKFLSAKSEAISLSNLLQNSESKLKILEDNYSSLLTSESNVKEELASLKKKYDQSEEELEILRSKYEKEKDAYKLEITEVKANFNSLSKNHNEILQSKSNLIKENQLFQSDLKNENVKKDEEIIHLKQENLSLKKELHPYKELEKEYLSSLKTFAAVGYEECQKTSIKKISFSSIVDGKLSEETLFLTKEILKLERENAEAFAILKAFTSTLNQMRAALCSYKAALSLAGKPDDNLLDKVRNQEEQIVLLEEALNASNESKLISEKNIDKLKIDLSTLQKYVSDSKMKKSADIANIKKEIYYLKNLVQENENESNLRHLR